MSKKTSPKPVEDLNFEEAFAELESIIETLEEDASQNSLEESMSMFERGQALVRRCSELLDGAELKVRELSGDQMPDFEVGE